MGLEMNPERLINVPEMVFKRPEYGAKKDLKNCPKMHIFHVSKV